MPLRRTRLFEFHQAARAKIVPFAGWEMPVSYPEGIFAEHAATRTGAALFDVSHMSVFDVRGRAAGRFLDALLTNRVDNLKVGRAAYQYLLRPDGIALDDAYVYRLAAERYLLVVNAANAAADWAWIVAAASGRYAVDPDRPEILMPGPVEIRDLRDAGEDGLLDIALQGPRSRDILISLADDPESSTTLLAMKRNDVARVRVAGMELWASMTGYTGEPVGFELFVHPDRVVELWERLVKAGAHPAGLGARDAARLEAGLPLFGHELEGALGGTLTEAGYGWVPRMTKAWFVGRNAYRARVGETPARKMVRLAGVGAKTVREGHRVLDDDGAAAGVITSFAFLDDDKNFVTLAYVNADFDDSPGRAVRCARIKGDPADEADLQSKLVDMHVLTRFPSRAELAEWRESYAKKS
jgi:glycine hydroxymethyltransferase